MFKHNDLSMTFWGFTNDLLMAFRGVCYRPTNHILMTCGREEHHEADLEEGGLWRDAVRGARLGLEYLDLLRDVLASAPTSQ